jgi:hypothetical protein
MISKKLIFSNATIILLLVPVSSVFAQPEPIPVQPPPVINTPPTIFGQPGTTNNKTPWQLCQSMPLSCGIGGGTAGASQPNTAAANTNTAQTTASPTTAQGASNGLSAQGCLQGDSLGANGLCIHTQAPTNTPQQQPQIPQQLQQQPQYPYNYQQQQIPTANFLPPQQQLRPQVRPVPVPSITAYQHTGNGTNIATNSVNCNVLNDTRCSYISQNNNGNIGSNIIKNNGLSGANLGTVGYLVLSLNSGLVREYGLWSFDPWIQNIVK